MKSQQKNTSEERAYWNTIFQSRYEKLNPQQKKAVDAIDGPVLVVAGPGSGKTEILGLRVGNILRQTDIRAGNVLCMTFTESAAVNMRERLAQLIGPEAYHVAIYTFHSFSVELIRRYPEYFYGGAFFKPADPITQIELLERLFEAMEYDNPLRSVHPEQGFVYLSHVHEAIGHLKKAGISPAEFRLILKANDDELILLEKTFGTVFDDRISMKSISAFQELVEKLKQIKTEHTELPFPYQSLISVVTESLMVAINKAIDIEKASPLSEWKETHTKKNDTGHRVLKDALYVEKLHALADVYDAYRSTMHAQGFYDFDDMLLDVMSALETQPSLRFELQEQFQYILVDEFQDTNNAQMRIIKLLADASVHEGRPNIMAVGDDDQAIFKFQGATISNILEFERLFKDPTIITMTGNYRSVQPILDIAREIIKKGEDRLENRIPNMDKTLVSLVSSEKLYIHPAHTVRYHTFPTQAHEMTWIAQEIARRVREGANGAPISPNSIAIITRQHAELEELVTYLRTAGVPIRYEREQNIFNEPHIRELIVLAQYCKAALNSDIETAESFLPMILAFPFWGLSRELIWKVSVTARTQHIPWLDAMHVIGDSHLESIRSFLLDAITAATNEPLEKMLDRFIGAHVPLAQESEHEDEDIENKETQKFHVKVDSKNEQYTETPIFKSPFRTFYFSRRNFDEQRALYLNFLSSLRVFISAIRQFRQGAMLSIADLVDFVDIHEKNNVPLYDTSPFASASQAVTLMTAHKAKGLEFETVFVVSCQDDIWAPRGRSSYVPFPMNMPIRPAGDTTDDTLRLFYVALTRARRELILTGFDTDEKGVASLPLHFLHTVIIDSDSNPSTQTDVPDTHDVLTASWLSYHTPPFLGEEKALLASLVENYKMSSTHLNNFLNVTKGGPQCFLEQNLLRFPQAKTPSSSYGSAVHAVIERTYTELKKTGHVAPLSAVLKWFEEYIEYERLAPADKKMYRARGQEALTGFYNHRLRFISKDDLSEVDFSKQGVTLGHVTTLSHGQKSEHPVIITGKIDCMIFKKGKDYTEVHVHDFKTGQAQSEWQGYTERDKIKLYEYRRQLIFYKILVEGSREWGNASHPHTVTRGVLDFVESLNDTYVELALDMNNEDVIVDIERTKKLARIVFSKIMNIDFPDVSSYEQNLAGIKSFEDDLLSSANMT